MINKFQDYSGTRKHNTNTIFINKILEILILFLICFEIRKHFTENVAVSIILIIIYSVIISYKNISKIDKRIFFNAIYIVVIGELFFKAILLFLTLNTNVSSFYYLEIFFFILEVSILTIPYVSLWNFNSARSIKKIGDSSQRKKKSIKRWISKLLLRLRLKYGETKGESVKQFVLSRLLYLFVSFVVVFIVMSALIYFGSHHSEVKSLKKINKDLEIKYRNQKTREEVFKKDSLNRGFSDDNFSYIVRNNKHAWQIKASSNFAKAERALALNPNEENLVKFFEGSTVRMLCGGSDILPETIDDVAQVLVSKIKVPKNWTYVVCSRNVKALVREYNCPSDRLSVCSLESEYIW